MNKPLLHQLYDGEIFPAEQIIPQSPEYRELLKKLEEEKLHFSELHSESEKERFDEMWAISHDVGRLQCYEDFSHGFRLGAGLMMEALATDVE